MIPAFDPTTGALPPGDHQATLDYREKLDALIAAKLEGRALIEAEAPRPAPVVNILDALKRSLESTGRKPPVAEAAAPSVGKKRSPRK